MTKTKKADALTPTYQLPSEVNMDDLNLTTLQHYRNQQLIDEVIELRNTVKNLAKLCEEINTECEKATDLIEDCRNGNGQNCKDVWANLYRIKIKSDIGKRTI